jgi:PAS domain S-box-containing protein
MASPARRSSEPDFEFVSEFSSIVTIWDIDLHQYSYVNDAFKKRYGFDKDQPISSLAFYEHCHPDDVARLQQVQNELIEASKKPDADPNGELLKDLVYRTGVAGHDYRWLHGSFSVFERTEDQRVIKIISVSNDISHEIRSNKFLEEKLEELWRHEERYHKMIEEVEEYAVILLNNEGIVENWNYGAEKIKGYKAEEVIGQSFRIFYTAEDRKNQVPEKLIEMATQSGKASYEGWRVRKDNSRFWGNIHITALHHSSGEVIGFTKVTRDLTEKKMIEDNLKKYTLSIEEKNEELKAKNKELESFTYIASHDLQEPLRKILNFSGQISETDLSNEKARDKFRRIQDASLRMQELLDGLIDCAQITKQKSAQEITDLNLLIEDVLQEFSDQVTAHNILIEKTSLPEMDVVRFQFRQLFSNIISNAIKYRSPTVQPKISIAYKLVTRTKKRSSKDGKHFHQISISDNGIGFKQQYAKKIFNLFQRLHNRNSYSGSGIGLAICKRIVEKHKGKITATSVEGKGTSFCILLPAQH